MNMTRIFTATLLIAFFFGIIAPVMAGIVITATPSPTVSSSTAPGPGVNLTIQNVYAIIVGIACYLIRISIALMVIAVIFYGLKFLWSQGDPGKVGDAKKAFLWGIVGILVILGTYTIIQTVNYAVGGAASRITLLNCSGR